MPPLSRRDALLGLSGTVALAALVGCTAPNPSPSPPSPTPTQAGPDPIDDPSPDLDLVPLYDSDDLGVESAAIAIVGGAMLLRDDSTSSAEASGGLVVVDAATGARRWTLADVESRLVAEGSRLHPRPPTRVAASRTAGVTMVATYIDMCWSGQPCAPDVTDLDEGYGIAALEIATGATRWHVRMTTEAFPVTATVVDADDDRCFANVGEVGAAGVPDAAPVEVDAARVVALAATDGSTVWERPGIVATHVGDVVLGLERVDGTDRVVALARASGETLWHADVGERVTVTGRTMASLIDERGDARIVDIATGDTLLDRSEPYPCFGDDGAGGELSAWIVRGDDGATTTRTLWSLVDGSARPASEPLSEDMRVVTAIALGYAFVEDVASVSSIALDLSGRQRAQSVEGTTLRAVGDGLLVLGRSRSAFVYAVG